MGILLAGGRGARLGLRVPKALALLGGRSLMERALETLRVVCDDIVVVAPMEIELPLPERLSNTPIERADDAGEGPLAALASSVAGRSFSRAVALGVDFPLLLPAALDAMLARLGGGCAAVVPAPGGRLQPLAAVYAPSAVQALVSAHQSGERSVVAAVSRLPASILDDGELERLPGGVESFLNVNRPEDLSRAERLLGERGPSA